MGQRLGIIVTDGSGRIAAAYYHWAAYTSSSANVLKQFLLSGGYRDATNTHLDRWARLKGVLQALFNTGAGISAFPHDHELEAYEKEGFPKDMLVTSTDRNNGLAYLTKEGIDDTEHWAEFTIYVDIDKDIIDFGVFYEYESVDDWAEQLEVEDEEEIEDFRKDALGATNKVLFNPHEMSRAEALALCVIIIRSSIKHFNTEAQAWLTEDCDSLSTICSIEGVIDVDLIQVEGGVLRGPNDELYVFIE